MNHLKARHTYRTYRGEVVHIAGPAAQLPGFSMPHIVWSIEGDWYDERTGYAVGPWSQYKGRGENPHNIDLSTEDKDEEWWHDVAIDEPGLTGVR